MEALVSGVAARVVFIDGEAVSYIEADQPETRIPVTRDAIPYLLLVRCFRNTAPMEVRPRHRFCNARCGRLAGD
jgi:hypothetical protein